MIAIIISLIFSRQRKEGLKSCLLTGHGKSVPVLINRENGRAVLVPPLDHVTNIFGKDNIDMSFQIDRGE
jgi:hypothetical protein